MNKQLKPIMEEYSSSTQANDILRKLNVDRLAGGKGETCDIQLKCGEKFFHAHKNVLSSVSEFFRKLFYSEMKEKYQDTVEVNSIDAEILGLILDFIYTAKITITTANNLDLLITSKYLLINELQEFCCNFILKTLDCDTFVQVWLTSLTHSIESMEIKCDEYLKENFSNITDFKTMYSMDLSTFKRFIAARPKHAKGEESAFLFIVTWVKHNLEERKHLFPQLFGSVDITLMDHDFFSNDVAFQDLVQESRECLQKVTKNMKYVFGPCPLRSIFVTNEDTNIVKMLDLKKGVEKEIANLNERLQSSFAVYKNYLYMVGGILNENLTNSVLRLDLKRRSKGWEVQPSLGVERSNAGVAVIEDVMFVFGGNSTVDGSEVWFSPEKLKLDDKESEWVEMKPCKYDAFDLVSYKDMLYAMDYSQLTCEKYDPVTETSTMMPDLPDGCVKVLAVGNQLYVICQAKSDFLAPSLLLQYFDPESGELHDVSEVGEVGNFLDACAAHGEIVLLYKRNWSGPLCICAYNFDDDHWRHVIQSEDTSDYWKLVSYTNNPFE